MPTGAARGQISSVSLSKTFTDNPTYIDSLYLNLRMTTVSNTSKGSEQVSEPIKYKVVSIDEMLDAKFWQTPENIVDEKLCKRNFVYALPVWRKNIQQALKAYAGYLRAPEAKGFNYLTTGYDKNYLNYQDINANTISNILALV